MLIIRYACVWNPEIHLRDAARESPSFRSSLTLAPSFSTISVSVSRPTRIAAATASEIRFFDNDIMRRTGMAGGFGVRQDRIRARVDLTPARISNARTHAYEINILRPYILVYIYIYINKTTKDNAVGRMTENGSERGTGRGGKSKRKPVIGEIGRL